MMPGARFGWIASDTENIAVSNDTAFFRHIFSRAKAGLGMVTYEQDFLAVRGDRQAAVHPGRGEELARRDVHHFPAQFPPFGPF